MLKCQFWKRDGKLIFPSGIRKTQDCPCPCFAIIAKCREDYLSNSTVNDYRDGDLFVSEIHDSCGKTYAGDLPVKRQIETYEGETRVDLTLRIARKFQCEDDAYDVFNKLEDCQKSNIKYAVCNQKDKLIMVRSRIDINCTIDFTRSWEPHIYCGGYVEQLHIHTVFQLTGTFERCSSDASLTMVGKLKHYRPGKWSQSDLEFPFWKLVGSDDKGEFPPGIEFVEESEPNIGSAKISYLKRKEGDNLVYNGFYVTFPYLQGYVEPCTGCESFGTGGQFNQPYSSIPWPAPSDYYMEKKIENSEYKMQPTSGSQRENVQIHVKDDYEDPGDLENGTCNSYRSGYGGARISTVSITPLEDLWGDAISAPVATAPVFAQLFTAPAAYADIYQQLSEELQS